MKAALMVLATVLVSGCASQSYDYTAITTTTSTVTTTEPRVIAAGDATKYMRFSKADYQRSLADGKTIHLYFYANWCPICAEERPKIFAAYGRLNYTDVVGYEVHYNDNEVTADDAYATKLFQIPYQHTTVILDKGGAVSFKSFAAIGTERLISEIERARGV
ncbi:MAG: thioredoxin family protein [Candidatus Aenigmarchaeota archaeon]|nr:thioredoxin family protein [Candidatus Aenigmarchaeota archaeon]